MEERETTKQKTETKKQKRARSGFWTWVVASVAFRLALVCLPRNLRLSTRPELLVEAVGDVSLRRFHVSRFSFAVARSRTSRCQKGHNVVLISNHQTEADPAVIALLLEGTHSHIAENVTYVAGDRVVTDPLCKPFSMGRNLVCVYSKKHMFDVPELVEMKRRSNT
ncbi:hypothetical protein EUGRSUZ_A01818 [Eucalyptus grandis]|uniref:Phospholipid/glycerol acyltransferase domain-containing protein n=2 Tax=Eucalyptus grandis TaxID=71139 RepID=A0A059DFL0_EUCGR|nr:hypothetical protein EUGRSUZ_A01818 [Eucalyptus grandis]